ncbi:hypothetical protein CL656_03425 [bacterium]|nr:hypothetical protein [bacterium]|tara:strand:- start:746 stop:1366 length:621 start_codon:yes stop_codon:yes gene_type:complete
MLESQVNLPSFVREYIKDDKVVFCLESKKYFPKFLRIIAGFKNLILFILLFSISLGVFFDSFASELAIIKGNDFSLLFDSFNLSNLFTLFFVLLIFIKSLDFFYKFLKPFIHGSNLGPIYVGTDSRFVIYNKDKNSIWLIDWTRFTGEIKIVPYKNNNLIVLSTDEGTSLKFNRFWSKNIKTPKEIIIFGVDPVYQIDLQIKKLIK